MTMRLLLAIIALGVAAGANLAGSWHQRHLKPVGDFNATKKERYGQAC